MQHCRMFQLLAQSAEKANYNRLLSCYLKMLKPIKKKHFIVIEIGIYILLVM